MRWDYVVQGPEHQVIVLDTRTWRYFPAPPAPPKAGAGLIRKSELKKQLDDRRPTDGKLTLVLSPTPVIGHPLLEPIQRVAVASNKAAGAEEYDNEPWLGNRDAFEDLLRRLAAFQRVIILSGDVHYAYSAHVAYFRDGASSAPPARIVQLCSSALKNQDIETTALEAQFLADLFLGKRGWLGFNEDLNQPLAEDLKAAVRAGAHSKGDKFLPTLYFELVIRERLKAPAVIPSGPWITDQAYQIASALATNVVTGQPATDWRYTVSYSRDERDARVREAAIPGLADILRSEFDHKQRTFIIDRGRSVVGRNNLGQISFRPQGEVAAGRVVHRLNWYPIEGWLYSRLLMFTEHELPLTPATATERPEVMK